MKLSEWARRRGITYKTAWRWARQGTMPVPIERTPTGTILVREPEATGQALVIHTRPASAGQQAALERHLARLVAYAADQGWAVTHGRVVVIVSGEAGQA